MSETIRRWQPPEGILLQATQVGWFVSHSDHLAAVAKLGAENKYLREQLAALQWRPITEQDLPKLGDEVGKHHNGLFFISRITQGWKIEWQIQDGDWTHFRPLNAPPAQP